MDSREARFAFGFLLLGLSPLFASAVGVIIFIVGILIGFSAAFA